MRDADEFTREDIEDLFAALGARDEVQSIVAKIKGGS
jgi:hypothetical protein